MPWFLDYGALHHVLGDRNVFLSMRANSGTNITMARGQGHKIKGVKNIAIRLPSGIIQKIENVLYSPGIMKNLLSIGCLALKGFALEFKEQGCTIQNSNGDLITSALREPSNRLYKLSGKTLTNCSEILLNEVANREPLSMLWHRRLGHTHYHGIKRMLNNGAVTGLPTMKVKNIPCRICAPDKQNQGQDPKRTHDSDHTNSVASALGCLQPIQDKIPR